MRGHHVSTGNQRTEMEEINDAIALMQAAAIGRSHSIGASIGAAVRDETGKIWFAGAVSTQDRIVGACAESTVLCFALTNGAKRITHLAVSASDTERGHPCGACLEMLKRFAPAAMVIVGPSPSETKVYNLQQLLP